MGAASRAYRIPRSWWAQTFGRNPARRGRVVRISLLPQTGEVWTQNRRRSRKNSTDAKFHIADLGTPDLTTLTDLVTKGMAKVTSHEEAR